MENPEADTEWNDTLRKFNILPQKKEKTFTEDELIKTVDSVITEKLNENVKGIDELTLDELDLLEDEEDERVLEEYRRKRIQEMKEMAQKSKFGEVTEIRGEDYVQEVNKAGEGIWVILHLYKQGIPLCTLLNQHLSRLASKFPATKFLKSVSTLCIPNFPDANLPTIFIYFEGDMKKQFVGSRSFGGMNLKCDELEWMLSETGAVKTTLEENPHKKVVDVMFSSLNSNKNKLARKECSDDENDWQDNDD